MSVQLQLVSFVQKQSGKRWNTDAHRSIVWKYAFLLHVLNKNENIVNTFWKSQKLIPSEEKPICPYRKN